MNKIFIVAFLVIFNVVSCRLNQETMNFQLGNWWNQVTQTVNHATQQVTNTANKVGQDVSKTTQQVGQDVSKTTQQVGSAVSSVDINNYKNFLEVLFTKSEPCAFCAALTQQCDQCSIHGNSYVCDGCEAMKLVSMIPLDVNILAKSIEVGLNKALCNLC